ncbi:hypothetical protein FRX31_002254 [Thalictrum thalictroides]|uniref:Uncharacterized protein n=1 Tax=Thalictrum thalictroides TaxID=46969 RepID=A0A7J6XF39_THATH|nr:hypothetical protein FRX31_002254 [Thalictrum thalictroides]
MIPRKFSSIAAGQTARAVAGRHGHNTKPVATGYGNQGLTMGHLAKSPTAGQCEAHMDEGKTAIETAAGQGCMGHDLEHSSMEAAAGQRGKAIAASCRQYDVSKLAKETAAGEGISGSFGELGVGVGKAAAGDGQHGIGMGHYAMEIADKNIAKEADCITMLLGWAGCATRLAR